MKLPSSFTTVTSLSKILAAILFITLPIVGFYLGMQYQKLNTQVEQPPVVQPTTTPILAPPGQKPIGSNDVESFCNENGGTFLYELNERNKYMECENIDQKTCESAGGTFSECESACRHDPDARVCIKVCVPVCSF